MNVQHHRGHGRFDMFGLEMPFAEARADAPGWPGERARQADGYQAEKPPAKADDPPGLENMLRVPGRFDDPKRDPAVDKDGTRFSSFLRGRNRREFARDWLAKTPRLAEARSAPQADLADGDIAKAWFVIHDVGVKSSLADMRYKANQEATKKSSVHGFLNRAGYFAATHDFAKDKKGTVYEFLSFKGKKIAGGKTINIETVPDIENGVAIGRDGKPAPAANTDRYASIGYRKAQGGKQVNYYKWTHAAFETLADLYILASARAGHLLTITAHKEMDRNLGRSVIWREYSAKAIRETTNKYLKKARDRPSDYHGDPYAFDIQALYDVITRKLNALGGEQMPKGARYGVHPLRLRKANGLDIGNGSGQLHEFPHQSDPQVKADTGLKKPGWWLAGSKAEAELESEAEALWERERFDPEWSGEDEERSGEEESLADTHDFEDEDVEAAMGEESLDGEESGWSGEAMVPWRESALHDETGEERLAWLDFEDPLTAAFEDEVESPQYEAPPRAVRAPAAKPMLGGMVWTAMHRPTWTKVTTFVTPQALKQERVEVLFFVHGLLGPCGRPLHGMESLIASKTFRLAANAVASGRPIILVVPQFQDGDDASWRSRGLGQPATLNRMMAAALLEVSRRTGTAAPQASALIVAGHSRAYGVLFELARAHASSALAEGALERLSEIWALDASYGSFPHQAFEALLAAKPALKVSVVYRADSPTDKFKGKAVAGRLALIPVDARVVSHCAVPAHAMPKLLAGEAVDRAPTKQGEAGSALHEHQEHIAGVLDEETQMMTWQESEAERSRVCPTCGSQIAEAGGMWPDRERGFEAEGGFDALDFEEFADFANETDLMFEESGYEADFVSEASGSSSFALLRAIPDNADYARFVPLDYRLNAKAIVGKLATDLEQLKDPSAKDLRKFAEDVSKFVSGGSPVGVMTKILVGALKNIPGGYLAAAAKIADDYAARGFSRGIVLGAARKSQSYLIDTFGREFIPENRPFPLGRKIAAANYVGGLLAGYVQGKALSKNQHVIFWKDLGRRMGDQSYRGATSTWRTKEWRDWYVDVAAAFRRYHLSS